MPERRAKPDREVHEGRTVYARRLGHHQLRAIRNTQVPRAPHCQGTQAA